MTLSFEELKTVESHKLQQVPVIAYLIQMYGGKFSRKVDHNVQHIKIDLPCRIVSALNNHSSTSLRSMSTLQCVSNDTILRAFSHDTADISIVTPTNKAANRRIHPSISRLPLVRRNKPTSPTNIYDGRRSSMSTVSTTTSSQPNGLDIQSPKSVTTNTDLELHAPIMSSSQIKPTPKKKVADIAVLAWLSKHILPKKLESDTAMKKSVRSSPTQQHHKTNKKNTTPSLVTNVDKKTVKKPSKTTSIQSWLSWFIRPMKKSNAIVPMDSSSSTPTRTVISNSDNRGDYPLHLHLGSSDDDRTVLSRHSSSPRRAQQSPRRVQPYLIPDEAVNRTQHISNELQQLMNSNSEGQSQLPSPATTVRLQ